MSLYLNNEVDPIAAQGKRQLDFIPKHFHAIGLGEDYYLGHAAIRNWIWLNQSGRFALAPRSKIVDNRIVAETVAAFEDSSEAIMFSFILPTLRNNDLDVFV